MGCDAATEMSGAKAWPSPGVDLGMVVREEPEQKSRCRSQDAIMEDMEGRVLFSLPEGQELLQVGVIILSGSGESRNFWEVSEL